MAIKIKPLRKFTTGVPSTSDMEVGELAVNTADKKIYMRDNTSGASSIVEVANASGGSAADDITTGSSAVEIATTTGNITIDAQGSDTDIIFKGTDDTTDITALTLDMSEVGKAIFNAGASFSNDVTMANGIITSSGQNLNLQAPNNKHAQIKDPSGNIVIRADRTGFAELRESGNTKLATTSTGVDITGNIAVTGNVDGRDVSADGTKLDGIEASADVTDTTNVVAALTAGSNINIAGDGTISASGGGGVTSDADNNTLAGTGALANVTSGQGTHNTAFGKDALNDVTTGDFNTAVGSLALDANTDQGRSTAVGYKALSKLSSGFHNTAVGSEAGQNISNGSNNVVMGYAAGYYGTSFNGNVSIGNSSMFNSTTSQRNVAIGDTALYGNTYNIDVDNNVAIGYSALRNINDGGHNNVGIGYSTAYDITTGDDNVTIGYESARGLTTGGQNVFIGSGAAKGDGSNAVTGSSNVFVGYQSGQTMTTGGNNVFLGGYDGNSGGVDLRTSSNNVVLSDGAGNIRARFDSSGNLIVGGTLNGHTIPSGSGTIALTSDIGSSGIASVADDDSPQLGGTLETVGNLIQFGNSSGSTINQLQFGGSQQLALYHLSNVSYIDSDSPISMSTTSGSITIDNQASDQDIIFKGTDGTSDITPLRLDMSDAGRAKFAANVNVLTSTGGTLTLQNSSTAISANDVLGKIEFQAPNEATGGTADDVLGAIEFNATGDITSNTKAFTEFTFKGSSSALINQEIVTISGFGSIAMKGDLSHSGSGSFIVSNDNGDTILGSTNNQARISGNDVYLASLTTIQLVSQSGDITLDATGADTDIIFKGTDNTTDITALTLDMSDAGKAIFNAGATFADDVVITSDGVANSSNLRLNDSGTSNNFGKAIEGYRSGIGVGQRHQILLGKDGSSYDTSTISYYYAGNGSTSNRLEFGFWSADSLLNVIADGKVGIGTTSPSSLLEVDGEATATKMISNATINKYGSSSAPITFTVTVATQTAAHPYNGDGSTNKYSIDGVEGAALTLHGADNVTSSSQYVYRFDQSDSTNLGHPLRFYLDAAKTTQYLTGVTSTGTPGYGTAYTQIVVTQDTPQILYYQCSSHGYMGNYVIVPHSTNIKNNNGNISLSAIGGNIQLNGDTGNSVKVTGDLETTGSIQLGNSSDTTLSRSAAGTAQIEGNTILTLANSDAPTTITSSSGVNVLVDDGGTMKKITPANLGVGSGGGGGIASVSADTNPSLGGDLDANGKNIDLNGGVLKDTNDGILKVEATLTVDPLGSSSTNAAVFSNNSATFFRDVIIQGSDDDLIFDKGTYTTTLTTTNPASQNQTITFPDTTGTVLTTGNSDTPTTITSSSGVLVLVDDSGTMKKITPANLGIGGGGGGSNQNAFSKFSVAGQTSVEADAVQDEVTLAGAGGINITTNASNDTITFTGGGAGISEEQAIAFAIVYG